MTPQQRANEILGIWQAARSLRVYSRMKLIEAINDADRKDSIFTSEDCPLQSAKAMVEGERTASEARPDRQPTD